MRGEVNAAIDRRMAALAAAALLGGCSHFHNLDTPQERGAFAFGVLGGVVITAAAVEIAQDDDPPSERRLCICDPPPINPGPPTPN